MSDHNLKAFHLWQHVAGILLLFGVLLLVFQQSIFFDFTQLDDQEQVAQNPLLQNFSWENIKGIFSTTAVGMYQALSSFFYLGIASLFGLKPFAFHLLSLCFHCLNSYLVYRLLLLLKIDPSLGFVLSLVFALHPIQVETIVWVSAFSTLCSSFFFLLGLILYLRKGRQSIAVILCFLAALLSKSMAVSFPLALLLLDLWKGNLNRKTVLEKIPLFGLSILFGIITIMSRDTAGHLSDLSQSFEGVQRIFLSAYSLLFYPTKFLFPIDLSVFYPYPEIVNGRLPLAFYLSPVLLVGMAFLLWKNRSSSFLILGSGFYLINIVLVIQVIAIGNQLTTDRYLYFSIIGFLIILSRIIPKGKRTMYFAIPVLLYLGYLSHQRSLIWENDQTIWENVLEQFPNVAQAHNNLGAYKMGKNATKEAIQHFSTAIQLKANYADAYSNRGNAFAQQNLSEKALADFSKAIQLKPHPDAYFNRGNELAKLGKNIKAKEDFINSISIRPREDAYTNLALIYARETNFEMAEMAINSALELNPNYAPAYFLNGMLAQRMNQKDKACKEFLKASQLGSLEAKAAHQKNCR